MLQSIQQMYYSREKTNIISSTVLLFSEYYI